jgi:Cupredoxin-like domain
MSGPRAPLALLAASLVLLSGCGDQHVVGSDRALQITVSEYRIAPQSIRAPSGLLTIFVRNYGRLTHNFVIALSGHPEASTKPIAPGQTAVIAVTLSAGKYLMSSTILADQALGTYGTLTVR